MFDMSDPGVLWLNITNFVMGGVVAVCIVILAGAVVRELSLRWLHNAQAAPGTVDDDHAFHIPELGLTMADGGEPERNKNRTGKAS